MAKVNTNTPEGIAAASRTLPNTTNTTNTTTLEGILAASNAPAPIIPTSSVDIRAALAKLQSGQALTDDEKRALGFSVTDTTIVDNKPQWKKVSTIITANGPVDIDANGFAADGSKPVQVSTDISGSGIPAGFTAGPFPKELEQLFGSSEGITGYKIETLTDKDGKTFSQLSVATGPNSSKTFGASFTKDASGKYVTYTPLTSTTSTTSTTTLKTAEQIAADAAKAQAQGERQSAYDLLYSQFKLYGLESLVTPLKDLITSGASPAEFTIKLRESDAYQKRFSANKQRISKGLKAISEAEYIGLEDQYQNILRNAGLPESYWKQTVDPRTGIVSQEGFANFIGNDVSAVELEDRVSTAQKRLIYANPEVSIALKTFYPDITNGDLLAYALDPTKGLEQIKRRITAAEVGSSAVQLGLATNVTDAEYLARYGVTKQTAQQGYQTIAGGLQRGSQLASIYGENPYTQTTAEQEVFAVPGAAEAKAARQKITGLEKATFGGQTGVSSSALARDRAGGF
jgi:hypothetical protein